MYRYVRNKCTYTHTLVLFNKCLLVQEYYTKFKQKLIFLHNYNTVKSCLLNNTEY